MMLDTLKKQVNLCKFYSLPNTVAVKGAFDIVK